MALYGELQAIDGKYGVNNNINYDDITFDPLNEDTDDWYAQYQEELQKQAELDRAEELKRGEVYRQGDIKYDSNGQPINDSDAVILAKEAANAVSSGADWLLEASTNIANFGQGEWLNRAKFDANINGKTYDMQNKDIFGARDTSLYDLRNEYLNAEENPNADKMIYTLRRQDGVDEYGNPKYIYKNGMAETSAWDRYKTQNAFNDGWEVVGEKRFVGAADWEKKWNALPEVLQSRVLDREHVQTPEGDLSRDKASGLNFGGGYTEILNQDLLGIHEGLTPEDYAQNLSESKAKYEANKDRPYNSGLIDAAQAGLLGSVNAMADFIVNKATPFHSDFLEKWANQDVIDKYVGYDRVQAQQELEEAYGEFAKGNLIDGSVALIQAAPGVAAESLGYMAPDIVMALFSGGTSIAGSAAKEGAVGAARAISWANRIHKAQMLGQTAKAAKMLAKANKILGPKSLIKFKKFTELPQIVANAKYGIQKWLPQLAPLTTIEADQQLNERIANKKAAGENPELSPGEIAAAWITAVPIAATEHLAFYDVLKGGMARDLVKAVGDGISMMDKNQITRLAANILRNGAKLTTSIGEEGVQEYIQTWGEFLISQYGVDDKGLKEIWNDAANQKEAKMSGMAGGAAGGFYHIAGSAPRAIAGKAFELATTTKSGRLANHAQTLDDLADTRVKPADAEENIAARLATFSANPTGPTQDFNPDSVDEFNKAVDIIVDKRLNSYKGDSELSKLGKSVIKDQIQNNIAEKAINLARRMYGKGEPASLRKVLDRINVLHSSDKTSFDLNKLEDKRIDLYANKFAKIMETDFSKQSDNIDTSTNLDKAKAQRLAEERRNKALDDLYSEISGFQDLKSDVQGSSVNIGDENIEYNDNRVATNGLSLDKLKSLISDYKNGDKTLDQVANEVQNYGYIEVKKNTKGGSVLKTYPSIRAYDSKLTEVFSNPDTLNTSLDNVVDAAGGATLGGLKRFSQSRVEKLNPKSGHYVSPYLVRQIIQENDTSNNLIQKLDSLVEVADNDKVDFKTKKQIRTRLNEIKSNFETSNKLASQYRDSIIKHVENTTGIKIKDITPEVTKIIVGHDVFLDDGKPVVKLNFTNKKWRKNPNLALAIQRNKLLNLGKEYAESVDNTATDTLKDIDTRSNKEKHEEFVDAQANNQDNNGFGFGFEEPFSNSENKQTGSAIPKSPLIKAREENYAQDKKRTKELEQAQEEYNKLENRPKERIKKQTTKNKTGKKWQKSESDKTYAEAKDILVDYKNQPHVFTENREKQNKQIQKYIVILDERKQFLDKEYNKAKKENRTNDIYSIGNKLGEIISKYKAGIQLITRDESIPIQQNTIDAVINNTKFHEIEYKKDQEKIKRQYEQKEQQTKQNKQEKTYTEPEPGSEKYIDENEINDHNSFADSDEANLDMTNKEAKSIEHSTISDIQDKIKAMINAIEKEC